jgi:hypothetical protein
MEPWCSDCEDPFARSLGSSTSRSPLNQIIVSHGRSGRVYYHATSIPEVQPIAFKATEEKKDESTPSRLPIDASKIDNEEMALIIKSFRQILKQRKGKYYKPRSKTVCYRCGKSGHFIAKCPYRSDRDRDDDKKGKKNIEKKRYYKKKGGEVHMGRE